MIKIIKQGEEQLGYKRPIYKIMCFKCSCEFEFDKSDLASERSLNPYDLIYSIKCPWCKEKIEIAHSRLAELKVKEEEIVEPTPIGVPFNPNPDYDPWRYPDYPDPRDEWLHKYAQPKDPCDTCPYKDGPKDAFGNPTAGDSMCQWCPHYKYRMVYTTTQQTDYTTEPTSYIEDKK